MTLFCISSPPAPYSTADLSTVACQVERHRTEKGNHRKATEVKIGLSVFLEWPCLALGKREPLHQTAFPTQVQSGGLDSKHPSQPSDDSLSPTIS